jgi:hypothetical protein
VKRVYFIEDNQGLVGPSRDLREHLPLGLREGLVGVDEPHDRVGVGEGAHGEGFVRLVDGVEPRGVHEVHAP